MSNQAGIISHEKPQAVLNSTVSRKRVLVFSPDADLARFLLLNLEDKFQTRHYAPNGRHSSDHRIARLYVSYT